MILMKSSVGRKILMAVTGLILVSFICVHLLGNLSLFAGADAINAYAAKLHSLGPIVWIFRLVLLSVAAVHIAFGIALTMENSSARPIAYMQKVNETSTFSGRSMIVTGLVILVFIVIHVMHFTGHFWVDNVDTLVDSAGRFDVYTMVVQGFNKVAFMLVYAIAMICAFLHIFHGIGSMFQTLGLANDKTLDYVGYAGKLVSFVLVIGYLAVIICGAVKA
jgi:succinate dehydrogenase / fumarate reductase cytochrome b subunit